MSLSVGIVGLPNVGKSTLFNALLKRQVALAANYPFATIDPNTGIVPVPDERLDVLAKIVGTSEIKPATVEFVDIAGLVSGASKGEGLGNQFLSHIREVSLIAHVVRDFSDDSILREGSVSPDEDRKTIETELLLADLDTLQKQKSPKGAKSKEEAERWESIERLLDIAQKGNLLSKKISREIDREVARDLGLITAKKMLYVVNVSEEDLSVGYQNILSKKSKELEIDESELIIVSAKIESELSTLGDEDRELYLKELNLDKSGLERLIKASYDLLGLHSFLTAGEKEVRAWTIKKGTKAPKAAGVIHTDFEKKFIKAKVASYEHFVADGGWKVVKERGNLRLEGKDYEMKEGDVVEFAIGA